MSSSLDMALDDIIRKNKGSGSSSGSGGARKRTLPSSSRGRGGFSASGSSGWSSGSSSGSVLGPGPDRRFPNRGPSSRPPYPYTARPTSVFQPMQQVPQSIIFPSGQSATTLYISNLDYGVSNEDIKVLFSEVGELERYTIHYDRSGRSKGTAEVVFVSQTDALAAMKRYNNVHLDGKPLKIELVGVNLLPPLVPQTVASNTVKSDSGFRSGQQIIGARGTGWGHSHGIGGNSGFTRGLPQGRKNHDKKLTAEELDTELDKYHLQSMLMK